MSVLTSPRLITPTFDGSNGEADRRLRAPPRQKKPRDLIPQPTVGPPQAKYGTAFIPINPRLIAPPPSAAANDGSKGRADGGAPPLQRKKPLEVAPQLAPVPTQAKGRKVRIYTGLRLIAPPIFPADHINSKGGDALSALPPQKKPRDLVPLPAAYHTQDKGNSEQYLVWTFSDAGVESGGAERPAVEGHQPEMSALTGGTAGLGTAHEEAAMITPEELEGSQLYRDTILLPIKSPPAAQPFEFAVPPVVQPFTFSLLVDALGVEPLFLDKELTERVAKGIGLEYPLVSDCR